MTQPSLTTPRLSDGRGQRSPQTDKESTERRLKHILGTGGQPSSMSAQGGALSGGAHLEPYPNTRLGGPNFVRDFENSLEIPATPSTVGRLSVGASDMGQQELNTSAFEDRLVRQVREIVNLRQQEIRKTEENLSMALKELQNVKRSEEALLQRRVAHFTQEFKETISELERQFLAKAEELKRAMVGKIEEQKAQCEATIEGKMLALSHSLQLNPSALASTPTTEFRAQPTASMPPPPALPSASRPSAIISDSEESEGDGTVMLSDPRRGQSSSSKSNHGREQGHFKESTWQKKPASPGHRGGQHALKPRRAAPHRPVKVLDLLDSDDD